MREIMILKCDYNEYSDSISSQFLDGWETISEEDYEILSKWLKIHDYTLRLIERIPRTQIQDLIAEVKKTGEDLQRKQEADRARRVQDEERRAQKARER